MPSLPSIRELVSGWPTWALPGIVSLLSPWITQLMRFPLISDYYQPQLNSATTVLVAAAFLGTYAFLVREAVKTKKAWLRRAAGALIVSFVACILIPVLLGQGWSIPTVVVDMVNVLHILFYVAFFGAFSVALMDAFLLVPSIRPQRQRRVENPKHSPQDTHMGTKIRVLFLAANPKDTDKLRLDEEIRSIDQALRDAAFRDKFEIAQHWAVRVADLQGHLLRHTPHVLHFSGHGSTSSEIVLEDQNGNSRAVPTDALRQLFSVLKDNLRCVILNACYSEQQAHAIAQEIECVVGMSHAIGDQAAISFAAAFYQAIGYGRDIQTAFELGRGRIHLEGSDEHATPKLIALNIDPKDVVLVPKSEAA